MILFIVGIVTILYTRENLFLSISILGALSILLWVVTEYLWRYKPFKFLFWIDDFSGRYEGKLIYQRRDENCQRQTGELEHIKVIKQTGSKIHITTFTKKEDGTHSSNSDSKGCYVECTNDGQHFQIIYTYLNNGSVEQDFSCHYGTEIIKFIKKGKEKRLSGGYFTNRIPFQTKGEFKNLKWVSKNTKHEF
ncbi:hypothetical protein F3C99_11165 [Vitellibacter sp. q18]|nr:hypothetical protein [Aequorivita lutea]